MSTTTATMAEESSEVEIAVADKSPVKERKKPREKSPYRPEDDEVKEIKDVLPIPRELRQPQDEEKAKIQDLLTTRTGGAYIPPAKLRMMMQKVADKQSIEYQRLSWETLRKKIHGHVNKANIGNLPVVVRELFKENIIRGKGLLSRSIIQAQQFSPTFSHVYAALVAVINSKFPQIGELILRRLIIQFKRSFKRNDKHTAATASKFIAHLVNQQVAHEILALEILTLLLEEPTDDSVEIAIAFLKECGAKLTEVTPRGVQAIFDRLRSVLQESEGLDIRVQYMIEVLMHIRKSKFEGHAAIVDGLDLIEEDDQITHTLSLEEAQDPENGLNVFRVDPEFEKSEDVYTEIRHEILGDSDDEDEEDDEEDDGGEDPKNDITVVPGKTVILDNTEAQMVAFRRLIYLTLQSSLDYQEAVHKILKLEIQESMYSELCHMIVDSCAEKRTYEKFFGLMAERLSRLRKEFQDLFEAIFNDIYTTIHRFEITKLRNVTRMFAHLFFTDAVSWEILHVIHLNEDETTSASRIFIKILFQELAEFMGLEKLYARIRDPTLQVAFDGIFPRNNPRDTRFAINFFTSIGLGGLTVDLREHLKASNKPPMSIDVPLSQLVKKEEDDSSSSDDSSDDSSDSDEKSKKKTAAKAVPTKTTKAAVEPSRQKQAPPPPIAEFRRPERDVQAERRKSPEVERRKRRSPSPRRRRERSGSSGEHRRERRSSPHRKRDKEDEHRKHRHRDRSPDERSHKTKRSRHEIEVKQEPPSERAFN